MSWSVVYLALGVIAALCTAFALVQARRVYWFAPLYFLCAWLAGELALVHIIWQLILSILVVLLGGMSDPWIQAGLALFALSWFGLIQLHIQAMDSPSALWPALREALGDDYRMAIPAQRQGQLQSGIDSRSWFRPFSFKRDGVTLTRGIAYGDAGVRNELDIYQPALPRQEPSPVLLQVHGGGWTIGDKEHQGVPLMTHLAERGWVCVAINYRLSPKHAFPAHIVDVKKAIHWIRQNIADYGGDPEFIAITGGSAGGHLSSLAALTPNLPDFQPGFEEADTELQAAVPFYGVYDFLDTADIRPEVPMSGFIEKHVLQCSPQDNPELWHKASPINHVGPHAPPTFVVQGTHDTLVWVEEARSFVAALREVAREPVAYAELPGAQHAFEIFHSVRTDHTVNAVADFLEWSHARWRQNH